MADGARAIELLREKFPDAVIASGAYRDQHWVEVRLDRLVEVCTWLRDDPSTAYDLLLDVTAVHFPDDPQPMQLVYHLYSLTRNDRCSSSWSARERLLRQAASVTHTAWAE